MLTDIRTSIATEVDIVMRCFLNDVVVMVSFEVVGQKRKPGTPWVHQMIEKHRGLPTSRLFLVSWSGFSKNAKAAASVEPGVVLVPVISDPSGRLSASLLTEVLDIWPGATALEVDEFGWTPVSSNVGIWDRNGESAGDVGDLLREMSVRAGFTDQIGGYLVQKPNPQEMRHFEVIVELKPKVSVQPPPELCLRRAETGRLHSIARIQISGQMEFTQTEQPLDMALFNETLFAHGRVRIGDKDGLAVALAPGQLTEGGLVDWD